ncbi:hypothetical protein HCA89_00290 [Listeria innocua]|uniref:Uncharacterized protein n=1 Tax=Listeria innocua TaxID=1642 RepID=A0AB73H4S9_LISIO|nr:hypothetical protein [Listeria innocua]MBC2140730.1 hypothetical protein [Listeria innocua]
MKRCQVKIYEKDTKKEIWKEAEFLGVYQYSYVKQEIIVGEIGGVVAFPVAVVHLNNELLQLNIHCVRFEGVEIKS